MTFKITSHALKRMSQRGIPDPHTLPLKAAKKRINKIIRAVCKQNGVKNSWGSNYVYFTSSDNVYVCIQDEINQYTLITAFKI